MKQRGIGKVSRRRATESIRGGTQLGEQVHRKLANDQREEESEAVERNGGVVEDPTAEGEECNVYP